MRIAQVAPLYESVPPKLYGGTERVVSYLTEELVQQGHRVTLFASGDSRTSAELVPVCDHAARLEREPSAAALHALLLETVFGRADLFDVIHCHVDSVHLPLARRCAVPVVTTLHGRLDIAALACLHSEFLELPLVSISNSQRAPIPWASWAGTVHHGLPLELHRPNYDAGNYLVFLGRISPEKRLDRAIAIAQRASMPLRIAAKIDRSDREYFALQIKPLLASPGVEYLGEIDESAKSELLRGALALLFPIDWPEPFGLAMIEAMACGTPVIAACSPQAWSAAAVFAMLQACLGLTIDAAARQIAFRYPQLPPRVERVSIRSLQVGESSVDLTLYRYSGAVGLNVDRRSGKLDVAMLT